MKDDDDLLLVKKDEIFSNTISESERIDDEDDIIDIFTYENFYQEYDFKTGETILYLEISEDECKILYSSSHQESGESISIHVDDDVYVINGYNPDKQTIQTLDYFSRDNFLKFSKIVNTSPKNFIHKVINEWHSVIQLAKNSTRLINDGSSINTKNNQAILKKFRTQFVKYNAATSFIPAYCILDSSISDLHSYIASGGNDMSNIKRRLYEIEKFKIICPNSFSLLSSFVKSPKSTDLRALCDSLEKNMNNIEQLLNLYLVDELNLQDKEK